MIDAPSRNVEIGGLFGRELSYPIYDHSALYSHAPTISPRPGFLGDCAFAMRSATMM